MSAIQSPVSSPSNTSAPTLAGADANLNTFNQGLASIFSGIFNSNPAAYQHVQAQLLANPALLAQFTAMPGILPGPPAQQPVAPTQVSTPAPAAPAPAALAPVADAAPAPAPAVPLPGNLQPEIVRIERPRGEAGNGRTGFSLQREMGPKMQDNVEYKIFLACVRTNATRAGIDYTRTYLKQDRQTVDNVCKLCVKDIPYLTKKRFPSYWPIVEALKLNIRNKRKYGKGKAKRAGSPSDGSGDDDEMDEVEAE